MNFPFNFNMNNVPSDDDDNNRLHEELLALLKDRIDLAFEPNPEQEVPHDINFDQNELNEDPVNLELYADNYAAFEDNDDMNMEQGHVPHAPHNFPEDELNEDPVNLELYAENYAAFEDNDDMNMEQGHVPHAPHNFPEDELNEDPVNLELYADNYAAYEDEDDMNMEHDNVPHGPHNFPEDELDFEFEMNLGINGFFHAPFLDEPMDPDQGVQIVPDLDMSRVDNSGQNPHTVPADPQQFVEDIHEGL